MLLLHFPGLPAAGRVEDHEVYGYRRQLRIRSRSVLLKGVKIIIYSDILELCSRRMERR
jgi:hypothetical protein